MALLCLLVPIVALALPSHAATFEFTAPRGWTSFTPTENSTAPRGLCRSRQLAACAVDLRGVGKAFPANFNANVQPADPDSKQLTVEDLADVASSLVTTPEDHVVDTSLFELNGVSCGRITVSVLRDSSRFRQIFYFVPGGASLATLTYTLPEAEFNQALEDIENSVRATKGVGQSLNSEPTGVRVVLKDYSRVRTEYFIGEMVGALIPQIAIGALLTMLFMALRVRPLGALLIAQALIVVLATWGGEQDGVWKIDWLGKSITSGLAVVVLYRWARKRWEKQAKAVTALPAAPS